MSMLKKENSMSSAVTVVLAINSIALALYNLSTDPAFYNVPAFQIAYITIGIVGVIALVPLEGVFDKMIGIFALIVSLPVIMKSQTTLIFFALTLTVFFIFRAVRSFFSKSLGAGIILLFIATSLGLPVIYYILNGLGVKMQ